MPELIYRNNAWTYNSWRVTDLVESINNFLIQHESKLEGKDIHYLRCVRNYASWQRKYSAVQKQYVDKIFNKVLK